MSSYEPIKPEWIDPELGRLIIHSNTRARNIIMRTRPDGIYITIPAYVSKKELMETIEKLRTKLIESKKNIAPPVRFDLTFGIDTDLLHLHLITGTQNKFLAKSIEIQPSEYDASRNTFSELTPLYTLKNEPYTMFRSGMNLIICPPDTNFADSTLQEWLKKVITEMVRRQAKAFLPVRLQQLAQKHQFHYEKVQINSSVSRWGSCSARQSINLSLYLMTLPPHLIDYVLLHELCHTKEMNHGPQFWDLLNKVTKGEAQSLRTELRTNKTSF